MTNQHTTRDGKPFENCYAVYTTTHLEVRRYEVRDLLINDNGSLTHRRAVELDLFGEGVNVRDVFACETEAYRYLAQTLKSLANNARVQLDFYNGLLEKAERVLRSKEMTGAPYMPNRTERKRQRIGNVVI